MRRLATNAAKTNTTIIFINQIRYKVRSAILLCFIDFICICLLYHLTRNYKVSSESSSSSSSIPLAYEIKTMVQHNKRAFHLFCGHSFGPYACCTCTSWLLVQRAVREGDMNPTEACQERYRLADPSEDKPGTADDLPAGLLQLLVRSARLYERVLHLDRRMYKEEPADDASHPVLSQIEKLQAAFGRS